jgi:homotetrameric cytidine deaminase
VTDRSNDTPAVPCADELVRAAREAASTAYARYSKYSVGAAILTERGEIVRGCNVENASYGLSLCAERNAVVAARARGLVDPQSMKLRAVAIHAPKGAMPYPPNMAASTSTLALPHERQVYVMVSRIMLLVYQTTLTTYLLTTTPM